MVRETLQVPRSHMADEILPFGCQLIVRNPETPRFDEY